MSADISSSISDISDIASLALVLSAVIKFRLRLNCIDLRQNPSRRIQAKFNGVVMRAKQWPIESACPT
jgi:hypothetical protein